MIEVDEFDVGPWAQASLRIASDTLSVEEISDLLGLRASHARTSEGEPAFTVWMYEPGLAPSENAVDHLMILLERLRDCREALARLTATAAVEIWVSFSPGHRQRSVVLDAGALELISSFGIDLVMDTYPSPKHS
ncbi:MAG: DUF4279 domain-containing protein [Microthrixaceae bacterium]